MRVAPVVFFYCLLLTAPICRAQDDPYMWLEQVESPKALSWVHQQSEKTLEFLSGQPNFENFRKESLKIMDSDERVPSIRILGDIPFSITKIQKAAMPARPTTARGLG